MNLVSTVSNALQILADTFRSYCKSGKQIEETVNPHKLHMVHMAMGISGEAGEIIDTVKKYAIYNKELDPANIREEIGDCLFYLQGLADGIDATLEEIIRENRDKLDKRYYSGSFSDRQAQERADKNE